MVKNTLTVDHSLNDIILLRKELVDLDQFYLLNCGWTATIGSGQQTWKKSSAKMNKGVLWESVTWNLQWKAL